MVTSDISLPDNFELRFQCLLNRDRALAFPCDALGQVDLDLLSARSLDNYLYARVFVGREFEQPLVAPALSR